MADNNIQLKTLNSEVDSWLIWFTTLASALVFVSLFVVSAAWWHLTITALTLVVLWKTSSSPFRTLAYILSLVLFLAILQIIFSPFMRALFIGSLEEGFYWSDWQYLMQAVERFAWPLVVVSSFQSKLSNPDVLAQLTVLLSPLKWLGFQIGKLQTLVVLSLRFIPSLKVEWKRFSKFQLYFVSGLPRKSYLQKIRYWQSVFKAMISHTIQRSMTLGELLAIRGLPSVSSSKNSSHTILIGVAWICLGVISLILNTKMIIIWVLMTLWLVLVSIADKQELSK